MYAYSGLMLRYMQNFSSDVQQFEDLLKSYKLSDEMNNTFAELSSISEYDVGEEGGLFKAPDPILAEPILIVDPLSDALTMISCGEDTSQGLCEFPYLDLGSLESGQQLLDKAFYECEQDLMMKSAMESPFSDVLDIKNISLVTTIDENQEIQKSVGLGNLSSMDWSQAQQESVMIQNFPDFDFGSVYGMRRTFSEGDIQIQKQISNKLGIGLVQSPLDRIIVSCTSEDRREKLSRYKNKKSRRNFVRKIKYACRKALADSQPRVRGRFAKTEESK